MKLGAIGECMLELSHPNNKDLSTSNLGFGGDTLNTLIYASRLDIDCYFFSALGTDPYSEWMMEQWQKEGVQTDCVNINANKLPGMYAIQVDNTGERSFFYWREQSAARDFVRDLGAEKLLQQCLEMDVIYFSGISLGILDEEQRHTLLEVLKKLKAAGKKIAFDGNYRPKNWDSREQAANWSDTILPLVDWYLPTLDDEQDLFQIGGQEDLITRHAAHEIEEVVIKDGGNGCSIVMEDQVSHVAIPESVKPIDTTAAGDSFNAGYIAARMHGKSPTQSALIGHKVAAQVIQHRGAIVDKKLFTVPDFD